MATENQSTENEKICVLIVGRTPAVDDGIKGILPIVDIKEMPMNIDALLDPVEPMPSIIICGMPPEGVNINEVAQLLSSQYLGVTNLLVCDVAAKLHRDSLLKNGFSEVFMLPLDKVYLTQYLAEKAASIRKKGKVYKSVKTGDIDPGDDLEFDTFLYLPLNNKHVPYTSAGAAIPQKKLDKLKSTVISNLYVSANQMNKFYEYSAKKLKSVQGDTTLSETERTEKLRNAVRNLFGTMFSELADSTESGKAIVTEGQNIVKNLINAKAGGKIYEKILLLSVDGNDLYSHSANVSSYAALFALGLGLANVEDIALAGLLHDVGLSRVNPAIVAKEESQRTPVEQVAYQNHVDYSLEKIIEKKLVVSDLVRKIILQHHEYFNGSGYPKKLVGARICVEAQILALADRFDELITVSEGKARIKPIDAMKKILADTEVSSKAQFDQKLVKHVLELF
ncbi:MAG: HD-GYP domain-containing protein [Bdellovibrionia bacterium]